MRKESGSGVKHSNPYLHSIRYIEYWHITQYSGSISRLILYNLLATFSNCPLNVTHIFYTAAIINIFKYFIIKWKINTTLSKHFQNPIETSQKESTSIPLTNKDLTAHSPVLVHAQKSGGAKLVLWAQTVLICHIIDHSKNHASVNPSQVLWPIIYQAIAPRITYLANIKH